jgi:hypothetical protein
MSLSNWFPTFRKNVRILSSKAGIFNYPVMQHHVSEERICNLGLCRIFGSAELLTQEKNRPETKILKSR